MTDSIAVVGGGIAGASAAHHLSRETDRPVTVYERGDVACETTAKSAAFFGFYGSPVERRMKRYGMRCYNEFLADPRASPRYEQVGRIRVATTTEGRRALRSDGTAGETRTLDGGALHGAAVAPALDADAVELARHRPAVGYFEPRELAREFAARARERGARIETGAAVDDVIVEGGRATGVTVDGERAPAADVVCAAGAWNPTVARSAGVDLPVYHSLAPILKLDPAPEGYTLPIVSHVETGVYVRGHHDGTLLLGHHPPDPDRGELDPASVGRAVPDGLRSRMLAAFDELLPGIDPTVVDEWVGVRSHTPDGHPIAGPTAVEGFHVAAFDSSGIQLSPAVGLTIARRVAGGTAPPYAGDVDPGRFD